jgi:hypothetical protein
VFGVTIYGKSSKYTSVIYNLEPLFNMNFSILLDLVINVGLEEAITYDFLWRYSTYRGFLLADEKIHLMT